MHATQTVRDAIKNTRASEPDHWLTCLKNRAGTEDHQGSYFPRRTPEQIDKMIDELEWDAYEHPEVQAPAKAFIARNFPGLRFGMTQFADLPEDAELELVASKKEGKAELAWRNHGTDGVGIDFIVLLIGPGDGGDIVWTFHPGDPIQPSLTDRLDGEGVDRVGMKMSKDTASQLNLKWVKLG